MEWERGRDRQLEISVRDDRKIVEIWLTREEQQDRAFRAGLEPLYRQYREKRYTVAVFLSGSRDLAEETGALLRRGKRRCAELEGKRERSRGKGAAG